ncbi:MAG: flagellar biosynthesis protein FlhF [Spirochaetia bacterium]
MEYFTEQALSHQEALNKVQMKYGDRARIMNHRSVKMGGFLGLFSREGVEINGYIASAPPPKKDFDKQKAEILATVQKTSSIELVLKEVQALGERLDRNGSGHEEKQNHPSIIKASELLSRNEFSYTFIRKSEKWMKNTFTLEELDDFLLVQQRLAEWIGRQVVIHNPKRREKPMVFIIVGPTGVGKTTTIAKLAATYAIGNESSRPRKVRILTIDNYRIGAKQQIETYGEIMEIPVSAVETKEEVQKYLALYEDADIIFIDTIGKSPKDFVKLAEMKELLHSCGTKASVHLAVSSTTKPGDIEEIIRQFESFGCESIILTKLDETSRVGNIISVLAEKKKELSYFTTGQRVPQDLERATVKELLLRLEGFTINRNQLEQALNPPSGGEQEDKRNNGEIDG